LSILLYPELKYECPAFTQSIERREICCSNRKVTFGSPAIDLARSLFGNATFTTDIVPYCSSCCDVIENSGNKVIRPLFRQVNMPVPAGSQNNHHNVLLNLLYLFWRICQSRHEIEHAFFNQTP
jgi:hypothetical protein